MGKTIKSSNVVYLGQGGYENSGATHPVYATGVRDYQDNKILISNGHYRYQELGKYPWIGGPFHSIGNEYHCTTQNVGQIWRGGPLGEFYQGSFIGTLPVISLTGSCDPNPFGAEAYARLKPTSPEYGFLQSIYELRELPKQLRQRFFDNREGLKGSLRSVGDYYLAIKFGWEPLLRDVRNFVLGQKKAQKRLDQFIRDEGRAVRREVRLLDNISEVTTSQSNAYAAVNPVLVTQFYTRQPRYTERRWSRESVWASARFRFWLPSGPRNVVWTNSMMGKIFGLNPSPKHIYDCIPWSWLIDWFGSVGDCLENLDAGVASRLAADYFYVMHSKENYAIRDSNAWFQDKSKNIIGASVTCNRRTWTHTRAQGDPFGFGTPASGLSASRLAILGALGLSRLR
jgi:hypothetical protein